MYQVKDHINIYCDESRHTNPQDHYLIIGAIACDRESKKRIHEKINMLRKKHRLWREFGWKTLSPSRKEFYWELIELFNSEKLSFRCIVTDKRKLDHNIYNNGDAELGFYKLYYQMLVHWLKPSKAYHIYLDWKSNRNQHRFKDLRDILRGKLTGKAKIECLEPVNSQSLPLIQLCDLLIGAVGYSWNNRKTSKIKYEFCLELAKAVGFHTLSRSTLPSAEKFNIFNFLGR